MHYTKWKLCAFLFLIFAVWIFMYFYISICQDQLERSASRQELCFFEAILQAQAVSFSFLCILIALGCIFECFCLIHVHYCTFYLHKKLIYFCFSSFVSLLFLSISKCYFYYRPNLYLFYRNFVQYQEPFVLGKKLHHSTKTKIAQMISLLSFNTMCGNQASMLCPQVRQCPQN